MHHNQFKKKVYTILYFGSENLRIARDELLSVHVSFQHHIAEAVDDDGGAWHKVCGSEVLPCGDVNLF